MRARSLIAISAIGGGMANTFLQAQGVAVGKSLAEKDLAATALKIIDKAEAANCAIILPVDAVVADFISGATEWLTPANDDDHWDIVEGQGSLFHPSFAGVSLGLLHGAQPTALVMCHEPTRTHMRGLPHYPLPRLQECIDANIAAGKLTSPEIRCAGISINTAALDASTADSLLKQTADAFGLPCVDPVRGGFADIVDRL